MSRWDAIHRFVEEAGLGLVFGLGYSTLGSSPAHRWDPTNALARPWGPPHNHTRPCTIDLMWVICDNLEWESCGNESTLSIRLRQNHAF